jgi:hypothetical protein
MCGHSWPDIPFGKKTPAKDKSECERFLEESLGILRQRQEVYPAYQKEALAVVAMELTLEVLRPASTDPLLMVPVRQVFTKLAREWGGNGNPDNIRDAINYLAHYAVLRYGGNACSHSGE